MITAAKFNRVFLDCLKNSDALLEKSVPLLGILPLLVSCWNRYLHEEHSVLWLSPSTDIISTANIFRKDHWVWVLKLKNLKKLVFWGFFFWRGTSIVTAVVLYRAISTIPENREMKVAKNTTSFLKIVAS